MAQRVDESIGVQLAPTAAPEAVAKSPRRLFWDRFRTDRVAVASGIAIVVIILLAISAPVWVDITHHTATEQFRNRLDMFGIPKGPNGHFWFGSDELGRDLFIRVLYGARVSLTVGFVSTAIELALALVVGLIAGYIGGVVDSLLSRIVDVILSVPFLLVGIALAVSLGASEALVIAVIVFFGWPYLARIIRGQVISLKQQEFVLAARSLGASQTWIMFRELLPNVLGLSLTYATLFIPINILSEATFSYLGVGIQEPQPSWGTMLSEATTYVTQGAAWWYMAFPGMALLVTVLAFNLFGDGLRDALGPSGR